MPVFGILSLPGCVAAGVTDRSQILKNVRNAIGGRFPLYNLGFGHNVDWNFLEVMSMENNGRAQRIYEDHDATQQLQVSSYPLCPPTYHQWNAMGEPGLSSLSPIHPEKQTKFWNVVRISCMTSNQLLNPYEPAIPCIKWGSQYSTL